VDEHDGIAAVKPGTPEKPQPDLAGSRGCGAGGQFARTAPNGCALPMANVIHARQLPRSRSPPSGLENFPEPAELATETASVKAELRQQIGVLAITGVHLIRELLAGLLSLVVIALALQQLHNLVFADVHELSFPSNW
jgi:hypothetical protein